ncbi:hypothetical protein BHM03_00035756, partial [Ensete ventricosum]
MAGEVLKWDGLLRWSLSHADGIRPARILRYCVSEEDRKWLVEALQAQTLDVAKRMKEIQLVMSITEDVLELQGIEPLATGWYRQKSTVGDRFRPLAVDFDCQRSIEGEKRKKKKRKRIKRREEENIAPVLARGSSARRRLRIARAHCRPHPRGEKDRGD